MSETETPNSQAEAVQDAETNNVQPEVLQDEAETTDTGNPLEGRIAELESALTAEKDKYLRTCAEFENSKRRREQDMADFHKYASEKLIKAILPVLDSFDLAVQHAEANGKSDDEIVSGFVLIRKQIEGFLDKCDVHKIEALNQPFDPHLHQAISQEAADGVESQTVIREMQPGYKLHDRLIRPAMVVVAS